jgi:hypothetical protein
MNDRIKTADRAFTACTTIDCGGGRDGLRDFRRTTEGVEAEDGQVFRVEPSGETAQPEGTPILDLYSLDHATPDDKPVGQLVTPRHWR